MSKQLIIDQISLTTAAKMIMVEGVDGVRRPRLIGKLQSAETKNGNGRVYPFEVLKREIQAYIEGPLKMNTSLGELDHPDSTIISYSNASHLIKRIWWEGKDVMGEIELLNTPSGKIAQELMAAGIPLGISSRGMGSVKQLGETVEVQDDFELLCWDLVSVPSTPMAYMKQGSRGGSNGMNLNESLNRGGRKTTPYTKVNETITEILCNLTGVCALCPEGKV